MFSLINGKPKFYIGKINEIGYADDKEREEIIRQLKEEDENVKIIDEEVIIDEGFKKKAIALGELELTYSKSEFLQYLNGEKTVPELEIVKQKEKNKELKKELEELKSVNKVNMMAMIEVHKRINKIEGGGEK